MNNLMPKEEPTRHLSDKIALTIYKPSVVLVDFATTLLHPFNGFFPGQPG